jgi:predicted dehydrogenase
VPKVNSIHRRDFLTRATGAVVGLGLPAIIPISALGGEGGVAASERIAMGCIGVGGQGTANLRAFLNSDGVQVVAVCDVDRRHRESARNRVNRFYGHEGNGGCATYNDFRELLARDDIDAVTICTPDHWHALIATASARAGKDMYCEKPLANSVVEGRAVCEEVKRCGRVLQTGSHERSRHNARFACELVRNGRLGKLHTIRVNMPIDHSVSIPPQPLMPVPEGFDYDTWLGPAPWEPYTKRRCHFWFRYVLDYSGGEMTDRGAHIIDLAQLGLGADHTGPVEIEAHGKAPQDGLFNTFDEYQFECKYANGVRLIGEKKWPRGIKFEGSDGWVFIHIHGGHLEAEPRSLLREVFGPNEVQLGRSPGHHRDFLNAVRNQTTPMAPPEVGHRSASICHLINIALITDKKLLWNPLTESIRGDNEIARKMLAKPMRGSWRL